MIDQDLVEQVLNGDSGAYRHLVTRYRNRAYGIAISYVGDFDVAEDLAQSAFIRAFYRLHTLREPDRFGAWLLSIVGNLCRMEMRNRAVIPVRAHEVDLEAVPAQEPPPDVAYENRQQHYRVLDALDTLSQNEREAVVLYYLEDEKIETVAQFLGITPGAVKGRLHRGRRKLRKEMTSMTKKTMAQKQLGDEFTEKIDIRSFADWARLNDQEIQKTLRQIDVRDLVLALQGGGESLKQVERRVMANMSERVQKFVRQEIAELSATEEEIDAMREKILKMILRMQIFGSIRPPSSAPDQRQFKEAVEEGIGLWMSEPKQTGSLRYLMPSVAYLVKEVGIEKSREALKDVSDPILQEGLKFIAEKASAEKMGQGLADLKTHALEQAGKDLDLVVSSIASIAEGKSPQEIHELVSA